MIKDQVDIITLNYNGEKILPLLFESLRKVTYPNHNIYMVDNGSTDNSVVETEKTYPEVHIIKSKTNLFFSRGNNLAINQTEGEFILLVNNDIVVEPDFLDLMVKKIKTDTKISAVACKMRLYQNPTLLDSIGVVMLDNGSPFNRGIGQVDLGQYDTSEQTFGACFGCVLIRRDYYQGDIGPLDNSYYGYFEDTDWCFRSNLFGYKIVTEPKAVVYHAHSVSTRKNTPGWKLFLIYRNFIWTAQKNFRLTQAIKITLVRYRELVRDVIKERSFEKFKLNSRIVLTTLLTLPRTLFKRFVIQRKRKLNDNAIIKFSDGERPFFEDVNYKSIYSLEHLAFVFSKLAKKDVKYKDLLKRVDELQKPGLQNQSDYDEQVSQFIDSLNFIDAIEKENFIKDILQN